MEPIAKAWSTAVRTALPGPWRPRLVVTETLAALLLAGLAALIELVTVSGLELVVPPLVALLFLLRRGLPATVLVLTAAACGWAGGPLPLLICAGWSAGARVVRVPALAGSFAGALALMTGLGVLKDVGTVPLKLLVGLSVGGFLLLAVLPALWGRYRAQRRALMDALRERNEQLLRERAMVGHQARLRERHRIAQDMHDSLGHQLALISVHSGALEVDRTLSDSQREAVGVLRLAAVAAMRELREVVGVLHDESTASAPGAADGAAPGGVNGIERLVESSRAAGTEVAFHRDGDRRPLAAAVDHAAYRIVQEALTNAHKHAPGAPITVALRYEPDALVVEVANAAVPAPVGAPGARGTAGAAVSGGQGLTGLRERARLVGGMVHAGPTPEAGFRLAALLPYDGSSAEGGGAEAAVAAEAGEWPDAEAAGWPGPEEYGRPLPHPGAEAAARWRRSPALGCAVVGVVVVLAVLGLVAWGVVSLVRATVDATVPKPLYDSLTVGEPEADVRRRLPPGSDLFTRDYEGTGPTPPPGSFCDYFLSGETAPEWDRDNVARFCFKDGVLVDKQHYKAQARM